MSRARLIGLSGIANIGAGILVMLFLSSHSARDPVSVLNTSYTAVHMLGVTSTILTLFGLLGLYALHIEHSGWTTLIGFILAFAGTVLRGAVAFFDGFMIPVLANYAPYLLDNIRHTIFVAGPMVAMFPLTSITFILGFVLFGATLVRADILPRWGSRLLLYGALLLGLGPISVPIVIPATGAIVFGSGQIWLGYVLWSRYRIDAGRVQTIVGRQVTW